MAHADFLNLDDASDTISHFVSGFDGVGDRPLLRPLAVQFELPNLPLVNQGCTAILATRESCEM